jgi:hypothetical protein
MRTIAPGTGSLADQLNGVAMTIRQCADLREIEYRWPRLVRTLGALAERAASVRRRGGEPVGIAGPLDWLRQVVEDHPALQGPEGAGMRDELLALIRRIGR